MRKTLLALAALALASACRTAPPAPRASAPAWISALSFAPLKPALYMAYPEAPEGDANHDAVLRRNAFIHRVNILAIEEYTSQVDKYARDLSRSAKRDLLRDAKEFEDELAQARKELADCERRLPSREHVASVARRYIPGPKDNEGRFELDVTYKDGRKETLDWNQVLGIGQR